MIETVRSKIAEFPEQFDRESDNYFENAWLFVMSGWDDAERFCNCDYQRSCNLWKFCPRCSYWGFKFPMLERFALSFKRTNWLTVDISFDGSIDFDYDSVECVGAHFDACSEAMKMLVDEGIIRGAMWREELQVVQFLNLKVRPHIHAICDGEQFDPEILTAWLEEHLERCPTLVLDEFAAQQRPRIQVRPITADTHFRNRLSYQVKALNLARVYREAWPRASANDRREVRKLNREVTKFLECFYLTVHDRHQVHYKGTMHASSKRFIGVPKCERAARRREVQDLIRPRTPTERDEIEAILYE